MGDVGCQIIKSVNALREEGAALNLLKFCAPCFPFPDVELQGITVLNIELQ